MVGRVPNTYCELLFAAALEERRYVEREGYVTVGVCTYELVVHENVRLPVHSAEMKDKVLASPLPRNLEGCVVPQFLFVADIFHNAGK